MDNKWIDSLVGTQKEKEDIKLWCKFIGEGRYHDVYNQLVATNHEEVSCKELIDCAKYDFKLADILYSAIKFVELSLRACIINYKGEEMIHKKSYLYDLSSILGDGERKIPCDTYYEKNLKDTCTIKEFIDASNMETLKRCFVILPTSISKYEDTQKLEQELDEIKNLRNRISHCAIVFCGNMNSKKGKKKGLKEEIKDVLKYIPSKQIVERICNEINLLYDKHKIDEKYLISFSREEVSRLIQNVNVKSKCEKN